MYCFNNLIVILIIVATGEVGWKETSEVCAYWMYTESSD